MAIAKVLTDALKLQLACDVYKAKVGFVPDDICCFACCVVEKLSKVFPQEKLNLSRLDLDLDFEQLMTAKTELIDLMITEATLFRSRRELKESIVLECLIYEGLVGPDKKDK